MPKWGRPSWKEQIRKAKQANDYLADSVGKPRLDYSQYAKALETREREPRTRSASDVPLERDVLRAVLAFLRSHPDVAIVWRMQSGMISDGRAMYRIGQRGLPDVAGMLRGGQLFAIEVKRPGGKLTPEQRGQLEEIVRHGGIAGVADSVEAARAIIEAK